MASRQERAGARKTASTPPLQSSMTPPPSTQKAAVARPEMRTPTPVTSHLSSPPPTVRARDLLAHDAPAYRPDAVENADEDELRAMIETVMAALREARTAAAHHKLQYNMLTIESCEAANRMAVEMEMAQREVEVLQDVSKKDAGAAASAPDDDAVTHLEGLCRQLRLENDSLRTSLDTSLMSLEQRESELASAREENERLRGRIRKNREHMNRLFGSIYDQTPPSVLGASPRTPRRALNAALYPYTPTGGAARKERPFEALLLADKVLSQEMAAAASTPSRAPPAATKGRSAGHYCASQSMSSLPSTPVRARMVQDASRANLYHTPPTFQPINKVPQTAPPARYVGHNRARRASSDSTISASSQDGRGDGASVDAIEESQASQAATSMLRRSRSYKAPAAPAKSLANKAADAVQTKLFGRVKKPNILRPDSDKQLSRDNKVAASEEPPLKKSRLGSVGLGIDGWKTR